MEVMPETASVDLNMARSPCFHELSYGLSRQLSRGGWQGISARIVPSQTLASALKSPYTPISEARSCLIASITKSETSPMDAAYTIDRPAMLTAYIARGEHNNGGGVCILDSRRLGGSV
jgi:hypothetical protein